MEQTIRFCVTPDKVRIAYATVGSGPPLVKAANWLNHLEFDWQSPLWRPLIEDLAGAHQLIRYDERGNGLSDWNISSLTLDNLVSDLESVVDACQLDRFALLGISQGGPVSVAYAVRHPERVSHLILFGAYARGWSVRNTDRKFVEARDALLTLTEHGWGQNNPAFRQLWTSMYIPEGTPEHMNWFNELQRISTSPANAALILRSLGLLDVSAMLDQVRTPTLVMHREKDSAVPFREGRFLAAGIPGARFVTLPGRNHLVIEGEEAYDTLVREIHRFLGTEQKRRRRRAPAGLQPGDSLGRWTIEAQIGAGGMGVVYRAHDTRLERQVAIKVLPQETLTDDSARRRFQKEALTLARLNHPHIAAVYDVDAHDGVDFMVIEHVPGETLASRLATGPLPPEEAVAIARQVTDALAEAHDRGVVHRDLKPGNIMVTPKGAVKVLDFGLARMVDPGSDSLSTESSAHSHAAAGTLPYMSPEQLRGERGDHRSDIWQLGAVLYEMAAGQRPFGGRTGFEVSSAILREPPAPLPAGVASALAAIILRCLQKDPAERFASAAELRAALDTLG